MDMSASDKPIRIRTALLKQEPYRLRFRQVLAEDLSKEQDWENLPLEQLYEYLSQTLTNAARKVLGVTRS